MRYEGRTFENETISLDDNEFVDCHFVSCKLQYAGGPFSISPAFTARDPQFELIGPAYRTLMLMQLLQGAGISINGQDLHNGGFTFTPTA